MTVTDDQVLAMRKVLIEESFKHYQELVKFIKSLPLDPNNKFTYEALTNIDQGMLWIKEGLLTLDFVTTQEKK